MIIVSKIAQAFIYLLSIWGAIELMTAGIKPVPEIIIFTVSALVFGMQLLVRRRNLLADVMIVLFAAVSGGALALFVTDLIFPPVQYAMDCEGHKLHRRDHLNIILTGITITALVGILFLRTHKTKNTADKVFSSICLVLLILCFLKLPFFTKLKDRIDNVHTPVRTILPRGC